MILTDKALKGFYAYIGYYKWVFKLLPSSLQNALIIEFFDSVGIYIADWGLQIVEDNGKILTGFDAQVSYKGKCYGIKEEYTTTRQQALKQAIIKARGIYNEEL